MIETLEAIRDTFQPEDRNGDYNRRQALEVCKKRGAWVLYQMLQSPNCEVIGDNWGIVINQNKLVEEILNLARLGQ